MTLDAFLSSLRITNGAFGRAIGVSAESVRRYRSRERMPARETMQVIARETAGAVMPNDFYAIAPASADVSDPPFLPPADVPGAAPVEG